MSKFSIRMFQKEDELDVITLWHACDLLVPWNNPKADIQRKLDHSPELFFVGELDSEIIASCMAGYDGHRGWIFYLAVNKAYQHQGYAFDLVMHVENTLRELGCPKVELMVRNTNEGTIAFYHKNDYKTEPSMILSKRLIEDETYQI